MISRRVTNMGVALLAALAIGVGGAHADDIVLEPGATFDGGICWEADGTEGVSMLDGSCMTPADYDRLYSYDNLATTFDLYTGESIADLYGITPDAAPASVRPIVFMGVNYGTFATYVTNAHQVAL